MIAVLGWVDGFGNDTQVYGIYPTLEEAAAYADESCRYEEFEFGEVNFDYFEAKEFKGGEK